MELKDAKLTWEQEQSEVHRIFRENVTADSEYRHDCIRQLQLMAISYHQGFNKGYWQRTLNQSQLDLAEIERLKGLIPSEADRFHLGRCKIRCCPVCDAVLLKYQEQLSEVAPANK